MTAAGCSRRKARFDTFQTFVCCESPAERTMQGVPVGRRRKVRSCNRSAAMNSKVVQFRVGVLVLVSLVLAGILTMLFGDLPSVLRPSYTIYVKFPDARGVRQGTPVR